MVGVGLVDRRRHGRQRREPALEGHRLGHMLHDAGHNCRYDRRMAWQHIRIARFGGPEVLEMAEEQTLPDPGPGEVRIKVLAAGTGFTDTFIRRGRYPDFKGPLPFTPGYDLVGIVEATGPA